VKDALGHGSNPRGSHADGVESLPKETVLTGYHGTATNFNEFKPNEPTTYAGTKDLAGIYFSGDERAAWGYANRAMKNGGTDKRQVIAANIRMSNPLDITKDIKNGQRRGLSFGDAKRAAMQKVTPQHDGVIFRGNSANPPEYIAFSNSQISRIKR
jgi:hypothetical protein